MRRIVVRDVSCGNRQLAANPIDPIATIQGAREDGVALVCSGRGWAHFEGVLDLVLAVVDAVTLRVAEALSALDDGREMKARTVERLVFW
jgi:hypothetical protein